VRILVFGAGAVGSLVAALLSAQHEVVAVARPPHAEEISRDGLRVEGLIRRTARFPCVDRTALLPAGFSPEIAFVTVKSYDTRAACEALRPLRIPVAVTMQNGLDNARDLESAAPDVVVALTALGVTVIGPGRIRYAGPGRTVVGAWRGRAESAEVVARILTDGGIPAERVVDVQRELWLKAAVNAGINPLTAMHRVANGRLLEDPDWSRELREAAREVARVAAAAGVAIREDEAEARALEVAAATGENRSSMLQDVERGRRTEIEAISGAVIAEARRRRIAVPVNERLYRSVRALGA